MKTNYFIFVLKTLAKLTLFCCLLTKVYSAELYVQEKFQMAHPGDYIVTAEGNTYSLLLIHSLKGDILVLEEISIPSQQINLKTVDWRKWLSEKAPGHTAWTLYEIDLKRKELLECFSCSKNGWIHLDAQEQFFAKLFTLAFKPLPSEQRKRIGPPPALGEEDHRKIWNPPLILEGKKIANPSFEIMHTLWPDDGSALSLCDVVLYFDAQNPSFPFPYWIDVKSSHYVFKVHSIESGHGLTSPITMSMPHRPPESIKLIERTASSWVISLRAPIYHDSFHLFTRDLTAESHSLIAIPHHFARQDQETVTLRINVEDLKKILYSDHHYQWVLFSDQTPSIYVKSQDVFTWK